MLKDECYIPNTTGVKGKPKPKAQFNQFLIVTTESTPNGQQINQKKFMVVAEHAEHAMRLARTSEHFRENAVILSCIKQHEYSVQLIEDKQLHNV